MTVYELIQKLATYEPDAEVVINRTGQSREQRPMSVLKEMPRGFHGMMEEVGPRKVIVLTDWKDAE